MYPGWTLFSVPRMGHLISLLKPCNSFTKCQSSSSSNSTSTTTLATSERRLLLSLGCPENAQHITVHLNHGEYLNALVAGDPNKPPLLLLHGWGAGLAFFGRNIKTLAASHRLILIDWLGFGASSRPLQFPSKVQPATEFFINSLAHALPQLLPSAYVNQPISIAAHSFGAYLATEFAIKYPHQVNSLILASPVGLPKRPTSLLPPQAPKLKKIIFKLIFWLWEKGMTPQMLVRTAGPFGWNIARNMIQPRFPTNEEKTRQAFADYFYHISAARPSAERSLSVVLMSGAYARRPLVDRFEYVKCPVTFLYGDRDWMTKEVAIDICKKLDKKDWNVVVVENAGHHLYYDNSDVFDREVLKACRYAYEDSVPKGERTTDVSQPTPVMV